MRTLHFSGAALLLASLAGAQQISFTEIATINLDITANNANAEFIGSNPSAVAYDGLNLTVAGLNNSGITGFSALVTVTDPLGTAVISPAFGTLTTPALRGYSGLDVTPDGVVVASFDPGSSNPEGIQAFDNGVQLWARDARGGSGVAIDPGFGGMDSGAAWTSFGSGRRSLQDIATGADLYDSSNGMIILTSEGTFWRDMDFADNGDVYLREGNNVIKWTRTGGNSLSGGTILYDEPVDADFVSGQNIAYLEGLDAVIYNDREVPTGNQDFFAVVKVIDSAGNPITVDWGDFAPGNGAAYYDFSWHAPTGTLALLDFTARNVHMFRLAPLGENYCAATVNSTGFTADITSVGSSSVAANNVTLFTQPLPQQPGLYFYGPNQIQLPFGNGFRCVGGTVVRLQPQVPVNSVATRVLDVAGQGIAPGLVNFQFWYRDPAAGGANFNLSNGLGITFTP